VKILVLIEGALRHYNSKFCQHLLETGHAFGKIDEIIKILYGDKQG
jgi:hypothetical protein